MLISKSITQKLPGKLTGCPIAIALWMKQCSLYLKKTPENIFTLQGIFLDYKMQIIDNISTHIQNISDMTMILANLGHIIPAK